MTAAMMEKLKESSDNLEAMATEAMAEGMAEVMAEGMVAEAMAEPMAPEALAAEAGIAVVAEAKNNDARRKQKM